ncbi:M23 family metallopeptidase [candidate division WWE3 bacterium]|nr:M23 family metallopeptidase [candidate division WWE3 bacterium]
MRASYRRRWQLLFILMLLSAWVPSAAQATDPPSKSFRFPWTAGVPWVFTGGPHVSGTGNTIRSALDFQPKNQDPRVRAADGGTVLSTDDGTGNMYIDHGGGWVTFYAHMDSFTVSAGNHVDRGDVVGVAGSKGTNNIHLHFGVRYNSQWLEIAGGGVDLEGWTVVKEPAVYYGYLKKGSAQVSACYDCTPLPTFASAESDPEQGYPRLDSTVELSPNPVVGQANFYLSFWLKNGGGSDFSVGDVVISGTSASGAAWDAGWSGTQVIAAGDRRSFQLIGTAYNNDFGTWLIKKEIKVRRSGSNSWYTALLGNFPFPASFTHSDPTVPPVLTTNVQNSPSNLWAGGELQFAFTLQNPGSSDFDIEEIFIKTTTPGGAEWKFNATPTIIPAGQSRDFVAKASLPNDSHGWWNVTKRIEVKKRGGGWYGIEQGPHAFAAEFYVNPYDSTGPTVSLTHPVDNYFYTYEILATATASDQQSGIKQVEFLFKLGNTWQTLWVDTDGTDGYSFNFPGNSYGPQSDLWILAYAVNNSGVRTQSGAARWITNVDTQNPSVSVYGPSSGQSFSGDYIDVYANASDNVGVDRVTFYLGYPGGGPVPITDANPADGWSARFDIRDLPNMTGMYVNAHAFDAKNNRGDSGAISSLSIARSCPCFEGIRTGQGFGNTIDAVLNVPTSANWVNLYLTPQGQGFRGAGAVKGADGKWRASWNVSDLPEGAILMLDGWIGYPNGQQQTPVLTGMKIDRTNPTMHLTGPGSGAIFNNTVTVTASAEDPNNGSGVEKVVFYFAWPGNSLPAIVDSDGSNGWQATFDTSTLGPGSYRLDAWVYDKAGKGSPSPEVWWITKN